MFTDSR
jgi:hypothetical protein